MEKVAKKLLSFSLSKEAHNGMSFIFNSGKFVSSEDYIDNPDEEKPYSELEYSRFFEFIRRYMDTNIEIFEENGILMRNNDRKVLPFISFDADIYHYHKDHLIFVVRHNVYSGSLDDSITDGRTSSIASTNMRFDAEGISISDALFLEHFMFSHNTNELRANLVVRDIENEPVIVLTIKPIVYSNGESNEDPVSC